jgi:hypothetical protein
MAITLTVNNIPFDYPEQGEQQPWGESATGWAVAVTDVLNSIKGPNDVLETSDIILNNVQNQPIDGFFFSVAEVRSFYVQGNVWRYTGTSSAPITQYSEEFRISGLNNGSLLDPWDIQVEGIGDAEISFSIDSTGQVKYTTTDITGSSGIIKFRGIGVLRT